MAERVRFHLDEHMAHAIARRLRANGVDVTTTQEAGLMGRPDEAQLRYAHGTGRVLVTDDTDFLALAEAMPDHAGVAFCRRQGRSLGQIISFLMLMYEIMSADEMHGRIEHMF